MDMQVFDEIEVPAIVGRGVEKAPNPIADLAVKQCAFAIIGDEPEARVKARVRGRVDAARRIHKDRKFVIRSAPHPVMGVPAVGVWRVA